MTGAMAKQTKAVVAKRTAADAYGSALADVVGLLEEARRTSARAVNAVMTTTYWHVGRRIVEGEQGGTDRAAYADQLLPRLSADLTARFGRGFSRSNLQSMRLLYLSRPICQTISGKSSISSEGEGLQPIPFQLPWSHYVKLLGVKSPEARTFYEEEALRGGWTLKQLDRQVGTQFYERTLNSRDKMKMLTDGVRPKPEDAETADELVRDPYLLEFLGLKDEYSESELEEALIRHLESFLLELGNDFTFVGRQRRMRVGDGWHRVDLLMFHRRLRCLVIIDLKTGELTAGDAGQMHLYCSYAAQHWTQPGENPPVGLILCSGVNQAIVRYALDTLPNRVMAAEYQSALPDQALLAAEMEKTRRLLTARANRAN
jgi:predicted nuclease of restriction endonuclease-like (RecB) superfamily